VAEKVTRVLVLKMKQQQQQQNQVADEKMEQNRNAKSAFTINFIAGGLAGTAGAIATCPLDVVQTRLQSSKVDLNSRSFYSLRYRNSVVPAVASSSTGTSVGGVGGSHALFGRQVFQYMRHIIQTEGFTALYKGIVPNLIGIAPSRAIYFAVYSKSKHFFSSTSLSHSSWTHMLSALSASFSVSTITNPIWFLKTRLQLDSTTRGSRRRALIDVIKETLRNEGIAGFYRGLSASYMGASETIVYFVIYERLKQVMSAHDGDLHPQHYACGAFCAKTVATISFYPHEVVRTRLRQDCSRSREYRGFFQTLNKVWIEEGIVGLYGGMGAHMMRQVPNTVIMFLLYESIVNLLTGD